jgi:thioredoxin 1
MSKSMRIVRFAVLATLMGVGAAAVLGRASAAEASAGAPRAGESGKSAVSNALPRMVDFGCGTKCLPCRLMLPVLDELKKSLAGKIDVVSVDVWENPREKTRYRIGVLPTQVFFGADGEELHRHVGFMPRADILAKWKDLGVDTGLKAAAADTGKK